MEGQWKAAKFTIWEKSDSQICGKSGNFQTAALASNFNLWKRYLVDGLVIT